ncbi:hypothetical protein VNO78_00845 [Psophocarpus tetragonolobus]|uniref:Uncharacterized protein n=1 Tax=Psophocarpus tetragonolobus TaxID=3891 RepID=A0AAN9T9T8_PSOTE
MKLLITLFNLRRYVGLQIGHRSSLSAMLAVRRERHGIKVEHHPNETHLNPVSCSLLVARVAAELQIY